MSLDVTLIPRGLSRLQAARYVGLSPGTFDVLVKEGLMPKPHRVRTRLIYDRLEIDAAFECLAETRNTANDFDPAR